MRNELKKNTSKLKGYMFEIAILKLLERNNFRLTSTSMDGKIIERRRHFVECRGRGAWHQIDCPCDYNIIIPFINPIKLLGEIKFYEQPISKKEIREFIGVIKDIQENYFLPDNLNFAKPLERHTELGVFFSANGFQEEAEKLAFAHNIKTISYEKNAIINHIKGLITELERNYLSASKCISEGNLSDFMGLFADLLDNDNNLRFFIDRFSPPDGFSYVMQRLRNVLTNIKTSLVGSTSGGVFLHFVSDDEFPEELFYNIDSQISRVFYERTEFGTSFYLILRDDEYRRKFYFSPPVSLQQAVFYGQKAALDEKERILKTIHISTVIQGINRQLILQLDRDWLDAQRE